MKFEIKTHLKTIYSYPISISQCKIKLSKARAGARILKIYKVFKIDQLVIDSVLFLSGGQS